jgi:hypothetical protein
VADTASKEQGTDIIAVKDGKELWVSVKGYPEGRKRTQPATQARIWFADAVFSVLLDRDKHPEVDLAVAFPYFGADRKPTYPRLADRMKWLRANLPLRIYWVPECGDVIAD